MLLLTSLTASFSLQWQDNVHVAQLTVTVFCYVKFVIKRNIPKLYEAGKLSRNYYKISVFRVTFKRLDL